MPNTPYTDPETIRRNYRDPVFSSLRTDLENTDFAERKDFLENRVDLRDFMVDLAETTRTAERMTLLHIGSGSDEAADLAFRAIEKLIEYSKWDYILEDNSISIGVMRAQNANLAVSLVCEYLGARVSAETRRHWIESMAPKGIELCWNALQSMRFPDEAKGWSFDPESTIFERFPHYRFMDLTRWPQIFAANNLRAVTTNGLLTGTVTYLREFGACADTDRWLEQARHSFSSLGDLYAPDGSYAEGVSYSNYTSIQMLDLIRHFEWLDGESHFDRVNWRGNAEFLMRMAAPTRANPAEIVSFGDGPVAPTPTVSMWVAARLRDPEIQWYALNRTSPAVHRTLLDYDPSLPPRAPTSRGNLFRTPFDWIVARNGHDPEDMVCAMRSGPPSNHEHADRNSIVLKCFGELLLPDPCPAPYSRQDPSWWMRFTDGHNAVLIDGQGHEYISGHEGVNASRARACLSEVTETPAFISWASDATQAYQLVIPDVRSVVRTLLIVPDFPLVVVADKVKKTTNPSMLQTRFFGFNKDGQCGLSTGSAGFTITRPDARLEALVFSTSDLSIEVGRLAVADDVSDAYPFVEVSTAAALSLDLVTLLMPVRSDHEPPAVESKQVGPGVFRFATSSAHNALSFTVDMTDPAPRIAEFQLLR